MSSKCPICGKPTDPVARPFCSKRCSDVDLQRWLSGRYVVPGTPEEDENPLSEEINRNDD
jgi:endogenous inhibitor of DNA gyrase (YacG/DUF329 family)